MNRWWSLLKVEINNTFNISKIRKTRDPKKIALYLILIISLAPVFFIFYMGLRNSYPIFSLLGEEEVFLLMGFFMTSIAILFFGFRSLLSKYYFSNDLHILIPLPLKESEIISSKFIAVLIREYLISFFILLPFLLTYMENQAFKPVYLVYSLVYFLSIGIIPLVLASILLMVFMRISNIAEKKNLIRVFGALAFILLIVIFQKYMMEMDYDNLEEDLLTAISLYSMDFKSHPLIAYSSFNLAVKSLVNARTILGFKYFLAYLGVNGFLVFLMMRLANRYFYKGLIEAGLEAKKIKPKKLEKRSFKARGMIQSICYIELVELVKTPVYFLNSILASVLMPIIFYISFSVGEDNPLSYIDDPRYSSYVLLGILVTTIFIASISNVSSTSISREGKSYWLFKTLPIAAKDQLLGRGLAAFLINFLAGIIVIIILNFILDLNIYKNLLIMTITILNIVIVSLLGLRVDIASPKLDWIDPHEAMKQNLNILKQMLVSLLIFILIYGLAFILGGLSISGLVFLLIFLVLASYLIYQDTLRAFQKKMS